MKDITEKEFNELFDGEKLSGDKPILLDFYAEWCGPCKMFVPVLEDASVEKKELDFYKINVDDAEDAVSKYGIRNIPTVIMVRPDGTFEKFSGAVASNKLNEYIENFLD